VTLQVPALNVQLVALKTPMLPVVNVTVPVGVTAPVPELSVTVAVQVVGVLSRTLAGEHDTEVALARIVEVTVKVPLLPVWTLSPP
jgi:hypothetical protein